MPWYVLLLVIALSILAAFVALVLMRPSVRLYLYQRSVLWARQGKSPRPGCLTDLQLARWLEYIVDGKSMYKHGRSEAIAHINQCSCCRALGEEAEFEATGKRAKR